MGTGARQGTPPALPGAIERGCTDSLTALGGGKSAGSGSGRGAESAQRYGGNLLWGGACRAPVVQFHVAVLVYPDLRLTLARGAEYGGEVEA